MFVFYEIIGVCGKGILMISRRGIVDSIVANPTDEDISTVQARILSVEAQAAALARSMQRLHGGEWRYFIDPISKNVFVTQFSSAGEVKKRR